jgi:hypothetical protein
MANAGGLILPWCSNSQEERQKAIVVYRLGEEGFESLIAMSHSRARWDPLSIFKVVCTANPQNYGVVQTGMDRQCPKPLMPRSLLFPVAEAGPMKVPRM